MRSFKGSLTVCVSSTLCRMTCVNTCTWKRLPCRLYMAVTRSQKLIGQPCRSFHMCQRSMRSHATIQEARESLKTLVGAQKSWGTKQVEASMPSEVPPLLQKDLPTRSMRDSYQETCIPLGTNPSIREKYINFTENIRFGRILEDLDTFAVLIGYAHCTHNEVSLDHVFPISIVTALVDRIEMPANSRISPFKDVQMVGEVTWAGTSSMEITMNLLQDNENGKQENILCAKFVMVARNPLTKKSAHINKLIPGSEEEKQIFEKGEENKVKRHFEGETNLLKMAPTEEERELIHSIFLQTLDSNAASFKARVKPENSVWMEKTILKNLIICFPEQRNLYNKIFGGYLMRKAFELAWVNASLYCKSRPVVITVDDIMFRHPVEVGSLLFFSSQVVFTQESKLQLKVHAEVVNPMDGSRKTTNDFYFTFDSGKEDLPSVVPQSYAESMLYLDGKRHFES